MKKIVVNKDACIGCGACVSIDDTHFAFDDEGLSEVINNDDIESTGVVTAIESCPTNAISIQEDNTEKCECGDDCKCGDNCECGDDCKCDENCECGDNCKCDEDNKCCDNCHCGEVESN